MSRGTSLIDCPPLTLFPHPLTPPPHTRCALIVRDGETEATAAGADGGPAPPAAGPRTPPPATRPAAGGRAPSGDFPTPAPAPAPAPLAALVTSGGAVIDSSRYPRTVQSIAL